MMQHVRGYPEEGKMVTQTQEQKTWLDAKEVARQLNVHPKTVYDWWGKGKMQSWQMGPGGPRRTTQEAVDRYMVPSPMAQSEAMSSDQKRLEEIKARLKAEFGL